ncbi:hypothetical protein pipiens_018054 [Culex pipiens pipiens]|uniref:F-box domain-containing protein n=1 Tax=Culex pipiens pipiens TaxID=38569 RepID=A0ABD1CDN6_CULPP
MDQIKIEFVPLRLKFPQETMSWSNLPAPLLEPILRRLSFRDKLSCSLVCRRWNQTVFAAVLSQSARLRLVRWNRAAASYELLDKQVLLANKRCYRNVELGWGDGREGLDGLVLLVHMLPRYALRSLTVNATPDGGLVEFFGRCKEVLAGLTELTVRISGPRRPYQARDELVFEWCHVVIPGLQALWWIDTVVGGIGHVRPTFAIEAPKLSFVKIQTSRWLSFCVLNLNWSNSIGRLELDIPNKIWRNLGVNRFDQLEVLHFADVSAETFDLHLETPKFRVELLGRMANLRYVQISSVKDALFRDVCRVCTKLYSMKLCGFTISYKSLPHLDMLQRLQNLTLTDGVIQCQNWSPVPLRAGWVLSLGTAQIKEWTKGLANCGKTPQEVENVITGCFARYSRQVPV